jgi:hypothetical protein
VLARHVRNDRLGDAVHQAEKRTHLRRAAPTSRECQRPRVPWLLTPGGLWARSSGKRTCGVRP